MLSGKIFEVDKLIQEVKGHLYDLEQYEDQIHTILKPLLDKLEDLACDYDITQRKNKLLNEILEQADAVEYGVVSWRNLATKQDLISTIRKEIIVGE